MKVGSRFRIITGMMILFASVAASADHGERGGMRMRGYDGGGFYGPSVQPVLPTRPFFVQPYPRNDRNRNARAFRHGYREGYADGYSDRDEVSRGSRYRRGGSRHDHYYQGGNQGYYGSPYYGPRPGVSIYYHND